MSDTPLRKPRLYRSILETVAQCMEEDHQEVLELSEDLHDHLQIAGHSVIVSMMAMVSALELTISRQGKLNGADTERALRLIIAEQLLDMEN